MTETDETAKDIKRLDDEELAEERRRTALDFQAESAPSAALTQRYAALNEAFIRRIYGKGQYVHDLPLDAGLAARGYADQRRTLARIADLAWQRFRRGIPLPGLEMSSRPAPGGPGVRFPRATRRASSHTGTTILTSPIS